MIRFSSIFISIAFLLLQGCSATRESTPSFEASALQASPCGNWLSDSSKQAPEFTLRDFDGKAYASSFFRDRPVILAFWASWCPNCKLELIELDHFFKQLGPGKLVVVGIGVHDAKDSLARFAKEQELSFPLLYDAGGNTARSYQVEALPHTRVISEEGTILNVCSAKTGEFEDQFRGKTSELIKYLRQYIDQKSLR